MSKSRLNLNKIYDELSAEMDDVRNERDERKRLEKGIELAGRLREARFKIANDKHVGSDHEIFINKINNISSDIVENILKINPPLPDRGKDIVYDKICLLFYALLRDHMPAGEVEELVRKVEEFGANAYYSNKDLAVYSGKLAARILKK